MNGVTKETKWELPAELRELKRRVEVQEVYGKERERRRAAGEPR